MSCWYRNEQFRARAKTDRQGAKLFYNYTSVSIMDLLFVASYLQVVLVLNMKVRTTHVIHSQNPLTICVGVRNRKPGLAPTVSVPLTPEPHVIKFALHAHHRH